MKKLIPLFLLCVIALSSCGKKDGRDFIVNKWRITDITETPLSATLKLATIEFKKDGTWSLTNTPAADQAGMYSLSDDFKTITTTDIRGGTNTLDVIELSKEQLIFTDRKTNIKFTTVPK